MKKILALSISLAFTSTVFAQEPVKVDQLEKINNLIKNVTGMSKPATPDSTLKVEQVKSEVKVDSSKESIKKEEIKKNESIKTEVKPVEVSNLEQSKEESKVEEKKPEVKKVVKKKKKIKVVAKKLVVASVNNSSVLVDTGYFHIPKTVPTEDAAKFETPISYSDITVSFIKESNSNGSYYSKIRYNVSFVDNRTGKFLEKFNLADNNIYGLAIKTDLTNAQFSKNSFIEGAGHGVDLVEDGTCQAVFVKYQLKTQSEPTVVTRFLDDKGTLVDTTPTNCELNKLDTKDTTFYTKNNNIVNVGFNQKSLANNKLGMMVHFNREGRDFFPSKTLAFAIPTDFSKFYSLTAKQDHRSAFFGVNFNQTVPSGSYYVLVGFEQDNKFEWLKTGTSVQ